MIWIVLVFLIILLVTIRFKNGLECSQFPPGPMKLPIFGSILSLGTRPHSKLLELKNKYGNIISINFGTRRGIVLNDYATIKKAYSLKEFQLRADMEIVRIIRGEKITGISWNSGKENEEQRAFAMKTLNHFGMGKKSIIEGLLIQELQRLFESLDTKLEKPIVNQNLFQVTSISALWCIISGEYGKAEDTQFIDMLQKIRKWLKSFNIFVFFMPGICKLFPSLSGWKDFTEGSKGVDEYVDKVILSHQNVFSLENVSRNFIEAYLQKIESTTNKTSTFYGETGIKNLRAVLSDFLTAGSDTVGSVLTWLLTILIYYPEEQEKIQREIDKVVEKTRMPSLSDRIFLPFVEAFIFEILRFSALVPLGVPHETSDDVKLDEYYIPKGTIVIPNVYEAFRNPKIWDEPETFKPERFMNEDSTAIERNVARKVDLVFGHGKRSCPGEALAKDEMFLFVTGLCQRYTFKTDPQYHYSPKIETELGVSLIPLAHILQIHKR